MGIQVTHAMSFQVLLITEVALGLLKLLGQPENSSKYEIFGSSSSSSLAALKKRSLGQNCAKGAPSPCPRHFSIASRWRTRAPSRGHSSIQTPGGGEAPEPAHVFVSEESCMNSVKRQYPHVCRSPTTIPGLAFGLRSRHAWAAEGACDQEWPVFQ